MNEKKDESAELDIYEDFINKDSENEVSVENTELQNENDYSLDIDESGGEFYSFEDEIPKTEQDEPLENCGVFSESSQSSSSKQDEHSIKDNPVFAEEEKIGFEKEYEKKSPEEIFSKSKKGAVKLNRTLILSAAVFAFILIFLFVFLKSKMNLKSSAKDEEIANANSQERYIPDFESMASSKNIETENAPANAEPVLTEDELIANVEARMPDMNNGGTAPVYVTEGNYSGGGNYKQKPDTRDNYVQKQIQGIKGLTPTGRQSKQQSEYNFPKNGNAKNPYANINIPNMPSKEEFVKQLLSSQGMQGGFMSGFTNNYAGNENFYSKGIKDVSQGEFLSSLTVFQGTVIPAVLITGINTDLPGDIIARVSENIYSSLNGKFLLIPQGSLLFANYNSSVSYAQNRVQVAWTHMIRPDGFFIQLGNMSGVDSQGYSGYKGKVDNHPWAFMKGLFLVSAIAVADSDISKAGKALKSNEYADKIMERIQSPYEKITNKIIDRALDIKPTITVKSGISINILTNTNLLLPPVEIPEVTEKYRRY